MLEEFKNKIIRFLKHGSYKPLKFAKIARQLGVTEEQYPDFKAAFEQLRQSGKVVIAGKNLITLPPLKSKITGIFRANPSGFGFVVPHDPNTHGDLFIPPDSIGQAMNGDTVVAKVVSKGKRDGQLRCSGQIVEILERAEDRFVGVLLRDKQKWFVQPDGKAYIEPIYVDDVTAKDAKEKDKVVVEIVSYPTRQYSARGVIIEVLGKAGLYESEIKSIIRQYHLPEDFNLDCLKEAKQISKEFYAEQTDGREDICDKVVTTIDPPDAKDFDDAISLEKDSTGNWILGVHIADVSSFVRTDSQLDKEAMERGNSIYLPGKTIPMLPEVLSNGICSLQPDQKRFVKSVYITYDNQGNIVNKRFANSVICSSQRLTYEQADRILKGLKTEVKTEVIKLIKDMEKLSRIIQARRVNNGMLHLDLPETELEMDNNGRVVDAHPADDSYPHTIIEMFMVEANEAVASLFDKLNVPFMRRIHPDPDAFAMKNLSQIVSAFGVSMPKTPDRYVLQRILQGVKGKDYSMAVNLAVLKSFEKAQYSPLNIGHFALASRHYCHFTSPIRRYADLLIHRLFEQYLRGNLKGGAKASADNGSELTEIGKHITFTEQRAENAENDLRTALILTMLTDHVGDEYDSVVTGFSSVGVFAQIKRFGIEGYIRIDDLGPDQWQYNQKSHSMTGVKTGQTVHLGTAMKVRIVSVNAAARQLNLLPVEPLVGSREMTRNRGRFSDKNNGNKKKSRFRNRRRR